MSTAGNQAVDGVTAKSPHSLQSLDSSAAFSVGSWRIEPAMRRAVDGERVVKIDPRNMRVLQVLAERAGSVVAAREIEMQAWEGILVTADSVYQSIRQLRRALGDTKSPATYIETVPRRGYRLVAAVGAVQAPGVQDETASPPLSPRPRETTAIAPNRKWGSRVAVVTVVLVAFVALGFAGQSTSSRGPETTAIAQSTIGSSATSRDVGDDRVDILRFRGDIALRKGDPETALKLYQRALQKQEKQVGQFDAIVGHLLTDVSRTYLWLDDKAAAEAAARRAAAIFERLPSNPGLRPDSIVANNVLGEILIGTGHYDEAEMFLRKAVQSSAQLYGSQHPKMIEPTGLCALLRLAQGRLQEAEARARDVLALAQRTRGPREVQTAYWQNVLAAILIERSRYPEALVVARDVVAIYEESVGPDHPYTVSASHVLAEALTRVGKVDEAESLIAWELDVLKAANAPKWRLGRAASAFGEVLFRQGRLPEAQAQLQFATQALTGLKGWPTDRDRAWTQSRLAELEAMQSSRFTNLQRQDGESRSHRF